jgi:oligoribonuclease
VKAATVASAKMPGNMTIAENLAWIDLEMTGLDTTSDRIIEIATLVTNADLDIVAEGPVLAIHQPESVLELMDDWNRNTHGGSGLLQRVRQSVLGEEEAEAATLDFLAQHVGRGASPMCGNSICQDRRFLARYMPDLERFFHYRNLDVSSLKELARRWAPSVAAGFTKKSTHVALEDIRDSVAELRYYRGTLIAPEWRGG